MLFVNIWRPKDSMYAVPVEKRAELYKAAVAYPQRYKAAGKMKQNYGFATGRGGITLWEFDSGEEMARVIRESPIFDYIEAEIIPLVEPESGSRVMQEAIAAAENAARK